MPARGGEEGLRAVYDALRAALAGSTGVRAVWGPELAEDPSPAAATLRAAGAGWDWSALGFAGRSFWDLHVGILPVEAGYSVGLHWTPALDRQVRPWARLAVPEGVLQYAAVAGEYQLLSSDSTRVAVHGARSAVDLALAIAARVVSSGVIDDSHGAEVCQ